MLARHGPILRTCFALADTFAIPPEKMLVLLGSNRFDSDVVTNKLVTNRDTILRELGIKHKLLEREPESETENSGQSEEETTDLMCLVCCDMLKACDAVSLSCGPPRFLARD